MGTFITIIKALPAISSIIEAITKAVELARDAINKRKLRKAEEKLNKLKKAYKNAQTPLEKAKLLKKMRGI